MPYEIQFSDSAIRDLKNLEKETKEIIKKAIFVCLTENPFLGDIKKLKSPMVGYRLRKGDYRILFVIEKESIVISTIKHRKDAYK
jgi:mRNA interferase RelE/StbE